MTRFFIVISFLCCGVCRAQTTWVLKKNCDGIKIYAGSVEGSDVKSVKLECILDASLPQLCALLLDASAHHKWIYCTEKSHPVKQLAENEQIYYSEMDMPFPISNRDIVVHIKLSINPLTRVLTVNGEAVEGYVPLKEDLVRVKMSKIKWTVTPMGADRLHVSYIANVDPAGKLPAWIVNMFITRGPYETFKNVKKLVQAPEYKNKKFGFLI